MQKYYAVCISNRKLHLRVLLHESTCDCLHASSARKGKMSNTDFSMEQDVNSQECNCFLFFVVVIFFVCLLLFFCRIAFCVYCLQSRAIAYKRQNFLKVVGHVTIIDHCKRIAHQPKT